MKYIKLFEDHGINQPEKSLDELKSDLASIETEYSTKFFVQL
jgi:hypothetical protein